MAVRPEGMGKAQGTGSPSCLHSALGIVLDFGDGRYRAKAPSPLSLVPGRLHPHARHLKKAVANLGRDIWLFCQPHAIPIVCFTFAPPRAATPRANTPTQSMGGRTRILP